MFQDSFGGLTTRLYDVLNRVATMSYTGQSIALREDFHYTARDQVAGQIRYGNLAGTSTVGYSTFSYDGVGRVINLRHSNGSGANIANYTNTYDLAIRITSEVLNAGSPTTYQYDSTDQLINDSVVSYSYDLNGNRTMTGYTTGPANELTSDGTWNYAYDKNGNLIQKTNISTGEVFAFGYDIRNRMVTATDTTTSSLQMQATYVYDAVGQRIEKNVEMGEIATITEFAYNNREIWSDLNGSNALQNRYLRTGKVLELPASVSGGGIVLWLLQDRIGSIRNVLNSSGTVADTILYTGFGNIYSESNSTNGGFYKAFGYRFDVETDLFRPDPSWGRYYDSVTGRWYGWDCLRFCAGDLNLMRYVGNDPMNAIDPSGTIKRVNPPFGRGGVPIACPFEILVASDRACQLDGFKRGANWKLTECFRDLAGQYAIIDCYCNDCDPGPPAGRIAYRIDRVPPSKPHKPCPSDHVHWFRRDQNPNDCKCFWHKTGVDCLEKGACPNVAKHVIELPSEGGR